MQFQVESIIRQLSGPQTYFALLKAICAEIVQNDHQLSDTHITALYHILGKTFLKAIDLIDKGGIEFITVDGKRSYFMVTGVNNIYTLYTNVLFCSCCHFQFNVFKKKNNLMCKHLIACHLAYAMKKCKIGISSVYM